MAIELFPVANRRYATAGEFRQFLLDEIVVDEIKPAALTVYAGTTERTEAEVLDSLAAQGFQVLADLGAAKRIRKTTADTVLEAYFTFEPTNGILLFYTNFRKTEDIPELKEFFRRSKGIYYIVFAPFTVQALADFVITEEPTSRIVSFSATRGRESRYPARLRPETKRSIRYFGDDGRETLEEMTYQYGVLPTKVEFQTSKGKFRVDNKGMLSIDSGELDLPFRVLERALQEYLKTREAYDQSSFELVPVGSDRIPISIPSSHALTIRLEAPIAFHELPGILQQFESEDYVLYNRVAREGSLYFKAEVVDAQNGELFRLRMNDREIRLFPEDSKDLGTFLRFYEFIVDAVDPRAEVIVK